MQQLCTYGSVRGALGQPASLPRQKFRMTACSRARLSRIKPLLSRDRKGAVSATVGSRISRLQGREPAH